MIIPIRCFTCGNILADKELTYRHLVSKQKSGNDTSELSFMFEVASLGDTPVENLKSVEGKVLDQLSVTKMCCRRHMLSSVDCMEDI